MRPLRISLLASFLFAACAGDVSGPGEPDRTGEVETTPGETTPAPTIGLVDTDGDGRPDAVDLDDDGTPELTLPDLPCDGFLLDGNGDGLPDGVDLDCDGTPEAVACAEPALDSDGDGIPDGIDTNCDGTADVDIGLPGTFCLPADVDEDGDGAPDGLDLDCDGAADLDFTP